MVVVTIIGISLMAFTPSFIQSMADRRCATASMELVRIGRRARSESIGRQRAHVVFVNYGLGINNRFQLLRGNSTHCDLEDWGLHAAACGVAGNNVCPENVNLSDTHWFHPPFAITVAMWNPGDAPGVEAQVITRNRGSVALCYEPSGAILWSASGSTSPLVPGTPMAFSGANAGAASGGGVMFSVALVEAGTSTLLNTPRVVLYPLGTTARRLR